MGEINECFTTSMGEVGPQELMAEPIAACSVCTTNAHAGLCSLPRNNATLEYSGGMTSTLLYPLLYQPLLHLCCPTVFECSDIAHQCTLFV